MQKYETVSKLSAIEFKRLTGVRKDTFLKMISVVKEAENKRMSQGGKPPRLTIEDRLLMTLEYLREYRTYFHLGQSYGLIERDNINRARAWARAWARDYEGLRKMSIGCISLRPRK